MTARQRRVVVTSLTPSITRHDSAGAEIGDAWQHRCIESWRGVADTIVSVNPSTELDRMTQRKNVRYIASAQSEGPPTVADLLDAGLATGAPELLLVNADVALGPSRGSRARDPAGFRIGRRLDIEDPDDPGGIPFLPGYDAFALTASLAERIADEGFVLGRPYWDYWLPLAAAVAGEQLGPLEFTVHHLVHTTRWSEESRRAFGGRLVRWLVAQQGTSMDDLILAVSDVSAPRDLASPTDASLRKATHVMADWIDSALGVGSIITEDDERVRYGPPRGWLDELPSRGERLLAAGFDPAESWFGPGAVTRDAHAGAAVVRTTEAPWDYGAVLALNSASATASEAVLVVELRVLEGEIGIGLLNAAETAFLFRRGLAVREKNYEVCIPIDDLPGAGRLVLQTWADPGPSLVDVLSIRLFD